MLLAEVTPSAVVYSPWTPNFGGSTITNSVMQTHITSLNKAEAAVLKINRQLVTWVGLGSGVSKLSWGNTDVLRQQYTADLITSGAANISEVIPHIAETSGQLVPDAAFAPDRIHPNDDGIDRIVGVLKNKVISALYFLRP